MVMGSRRWRYTQYFQNYPCDTWFETIEIVIAMVMNCQSIGQKWKCGMKLVKKLIFWWFEVVNVYWNSDITLQKKADIPTQVWRKECVSNRFPYAIPTPGLLKNIASQNSAYALVTPITYPFLTPFYLRLTYAPLPMLSLHQIIYALPTQLCLRLPYANFLTFSLRQFPYAFLTTLASTLLHHFRYTLPTPYLRPAWWKIVGFLLHLTLITTIYNINQIGCAE